MKWILYLLAGVIGLVLLAVIVLLVIGGGRGEATMTKRVEIAKPASTVFLWITEPARLKAWVGWLIDVQPLTSHASGVGSRQLWVMEDRNNNNQRMDIQTETTRYEPDRLLEAALNAPAGFTGKVTYQLEPIDVNNTRLTYHAEYKFEHWLAKLMGPIIIRSATQKLEEDLARLKQKAEAE